MVSAVVTHWRLVRQPTMQSRSSIPWRKHIYTMYMASLLIMIRSAFRVVEYLQGNSGTLLGHEAYLYALDATLMLAVMIFFNIIHPSEVLTSRSWDRKGRDTLDIHLETYYQGA